jgi:membrane protease YdiL (CAAX protease family)
VTGSERLIVVIGALAAVVILANLSESRHSLRAPLRGILLMFNILFVVSYAFNPALSDSPSQTVSLASGIAFAFGVVATLLLGDGFRARTSRIFPKRQVNPDTAQIVGFDPQSMVHMTALIFCLYLAASTVLDFLLAGGLGGMAQSFEGITTQGLWEQAAILVLFAVIGVGVGVRRRGVAALQRLGLRAPTLSELGMALAMAFFLYGLAFGIGIVWQILTPKDVFDQQTVLSNEIGSSINTLTLGFILAITAALGEEIAFRGALQPIFGLIPTTILFAFIHSQYILTPASLLIFCVGLGFGWLRRRYNTTTAIVAHFLYDFTLIALAVFARYAEHMLVTSK